MSNNITVVCQGNTLVVDSRLIALDLGIEHKSLRKLIEEHKIKLESKFGVCRFEIAKPLVAKVSGAKSRGGRPEKIYWLTETQSTAILTLVSNTDQAVDLKFDLLEKFELAKNLLKQIAQPILEPIDIYNLDQETMDRLEAWWCYREYPSLEAVWEKYNHPDGTLEGFISPDEAAMLDDRLKVMPDEVIKYLCGLWILGNMQYSPEGMEKTRNALCNDRAALSAQQFQTQLDQTRLEPAPTQKQLA